ncbi:MAG TPA: GGDEF domain-containing protein [Longimicrobiales bacterium]|nr:GGDEF domain-containing protein [Longimicrobiales bacterium]
MRPLRVTLRRLAVAVGFEGLLLGLFVAVPYVAPAFDPIGPYRLLVAVAAFALALAIGWHFRRGRMVYALGVLLAAATVPLLPTGSLAWLLAAALVPLNFAVIGVLPDRGIVSLGGGIRFAALGVQAVTVAVFALIDPPTAVPAGLPVPPHVAVWIAYAMGLVALGIRAAVGGGAPARGLLWATGATLASYAGLGGGTLWLLAGGAAALVAAGIRDAYARGFRDRLTGLRSRRALDEELERIYGHYTLAIVSVDHLQTINDGLGRHTGEQVLRMVAKRLDATRGGAVAYRYGDEAFTLLFKGKTLVEARPWLESARKRIEEAQFILRDPARRKGRSARGKEVPRKRLKVTVSIGAATRADGAAPLIVTKAAETALHRAREHGRNSVMVF